MKGFFRAIQAYAKAWPLLWSRRFRGFLLFPVLVLVLLFIGGNILVSYAGDGLYSLAEGKLTAWISGIPGLQWIATTGNILIKLLLKVLYFFLFVAFGGYIILIVMSPVYSWLSERIEAHLTGREYPFCFRQWLSEVLRGILIALRNMFWQLLLSAVFFLCSFIPVIGVLAPLAIFFASAYFYGFSFVDYAIERKRLNVKQSVKYINRNAGVVTGIGTVFALALMIPWFSLIACSFVSIWAVVAGTIAVQEEEEKFVQPIEKI